MTSLRHPVTHSDFQGVQAIDRLQIYRVIMWESCNILRLLARTVL